MNNNYDELDELDELEQEEKESKPKKKKFNIFDWYYRDKKEIVGDDIDVLKKPTIGNFFRIMWRRLGKLMSANILFIFGNFPIFFIILAMSGMLSESSYSPLNQQWSVLNGISLFEQGSGTYSPELLQYLNVYSAKTEISVINTPTIIFFCLGLLIIFTMGFTKVGTTYIYRNIILGEPIFPFSDFFYIIKRNIKQALVFGIIDSLFILMFVYNIYFLLINYSASTMNAIMLFFTICMATIYYIARQYAYIMIFTFNLKLKTIIKNSLYFVILGIKRNMVGVLSTLFLVALNLIIFYLYMPLGAILPFVITIAIADFIGVYAVYPNIDKYMVDHAKNEDSDIEAVTEAAE